MKSQVIDQVELAHLIYKDACAKCVAVQPDLRDLKTIQSRVENEGLSFLTITLPQFGKDFDRSLANEEIDSTAFRSFAKVGPIPAFLQGMISQVFDRTTGRILYEHTNLCPVIEAIRQIAYSFKKLELPCTPERTQQALDEFVQIEHELSENLIRGDYVDMFIDVSHLLWDCLFDGIDVRQVRPHHGPGAVAEGYTSNGKFRWQQWYDRLEPYFPLLEVAMPLSSYGSKEFEDVTVVSSGEELPVKVTCVPKTQKGPRIIAIEPSCMQYTQQAIREALYELLESHSVTSGHVCFTDQDVNRNLAMKSSEDGFYATLDLSSASDRVLWSLARRMFDCNPVLQDAITACRSTSAVLPDGHVVTNLQKFASMGSALCFPVEAMYFYTLCIGALLRKRNLPATRRNVFTVSRDVYVYGDDIFVPAHEATSVIDHLQEYNCKVNMSKSFWTGKFRESCGMDAWNGYEVTPTYVRSMYPNDRRQASQLVSLCSTMNSFHKKGYWLTSSLIRKRLEKHLGPLPTVAATSPALGRISFLPYVSAERWNKELQVWEINAWTAEPVYRTDELGGYGALQKCLVTGCNRDTSVSLKASGSTWWYDLNIRHEQHLERSARHGAVTLKRRWVRAY